MGRVGFNSAATTGKTLTTFSGINYPSVLLPAGPEQLVQWLYDYDGEFTLLDKVTPLKVASPEVTNVNVLEFASGGSVSIENMSSGDIVSNEGTAVVTATDGSLTVGVGTVSGLVINGAIIYPTEEGTGDTMYSVIKSVYIGRTEEHVYSSAGSSFIRIGSVTYNTLEDAVADAVSGDTILLGDGEYPISSDTTIPSGVVLKGHLPVWDAVDGFDIAGTHIVCGNYQIQGTGPNVTIQDLGISGSNRNCLYFSQTSSSVRVENIIMDGLNSTNHGMLTVGNGTEVYNCTVRNAPIHGIALKGIGHSVNQCDVAGGTVSGIIIVGDLESSGNKAQDIVIRNNNISCDSTSGGLIVVAATDTGSTVSDVYIHNNKMGGSVREAFAFKLQSDGDSSSLSDVYCNNNTVNITTWGHYSYARGVVSSIDVNLGNFYYSDVTLPNGGGEGPGTYDVAFSANDGLISSVSYSDVNFSGGVWSVSDEVPSYNLEFGLTPAIRSDETASLRSTFTSYVNSSISFGFRYNNDNADEATILGVRDVNKYYRFGRNASGQWLARIANTGTLSFGNSDTSVHDAKITINGTSLSIYIDGQLEQSATIDISFLPTIPFGIQGFALEFAGYINRPDADLLYLKDDNGSFDYVPVYSPANGGCLYDKVSKSFIYTDGAGSMFFSASPALQDTPVLDAKYLRPISLPGSSNQPGIVHNGFEGALRQTDTYFSDNAPNRWHDRTNFLDVYWQDIVDHNNGAYNSYQKCIEIDGVQYLDELGQYPINWSPTPAEYLRNIKYWKVCDSFADPLVPVEVLAGTGIGPDTDWRDNGAGKVLLVKDE